MNCRRRCRRDFCASLPGPTEFQWAEWPKWYDTASYIYILSIIILPYIHCILPPEILLRIFINNSESAFLFPPCSSCFKFVILCQLSLRICYFWLLLLCVSLCRVSRSLDFGIDPYFYQKLTLVLTNSFYLITRTGRRSSRNCSSRYRMPKDSDWNRKLSNAYCWETRIDSQNPYISWIICNILHNV